MEPFTITCATCASRIRVRNPDLIGQLANCPRCNSMMLIEPPGANSPEQATPNAASGAQGGPRIEVERRHGPAVDSTALTQEGLPAELVGLPPGDLHTVGLPGDPDDDEYRLAPEALAVEPEQSSAALSPPPVQNSAAQHDAREHATWEPPAHLPSSAWTSNSTTKTRQMLLVGFLGGAGVLLAALLFIGFLRWHASETIDMAATPEPQMANPTEPVDAHPIDADPIASVDDQSAASDALRTDSDNVGDSSDAQPNQLPVASSDSLPTNNQLPPQSQDATANASGSDPTAAALPSVASTAEPATAEPATAEPATAELPKQLQAFGPMLDFEIQPQFSDATEILSEAPVTAEDLGLTTTPDSTEMPAIDLAAQSKVTLPALVMAPLPLAQFVSLWSNLSGIPTGVDLNSLAAAGIDRNGNIGLAMVKSATIGSLIEQLGAPLGIQAVSRDNRFLELVASDAAMEEKLPASISLAGLVEPAAEAWLIESLPQLFPNYSLTWKIEQGKLLRPQTDAGELLEPRAWAAAARLLEGWRQAAGLPTTLPAYAPTMLSADLVAPSDVAGLDHVLQQVQPEARPLAQIVPRICREAGLHAWIDWPAVASIGLGPQSTGLVVTNARPLRRALADYASEFSLVVAVLDKQSLWLTSNQAYRASPQLYVIPSQGETAEQWKSRLRPLTPAASQGGVVGAVVVIATPDGKYMLVRCCPMQVGFQ